jgi:hypothetical protein
MKSIIDTLLAEHALFCLLFDEIDNLLPEVRTVSELRLLIRLVEGALSHHANLEQNLAYAALDHALAEKGKLNRLYQDHEEIDTHFRDAAQAKKLAEGICLFKAALEASREHFSREERTVFPLFKKLFTSKAMEALADGAPGTASPLGTHGFANALRGKLRKAKGATVPRTPPSLSAAVGH